MAAIERKGTVHHRRLTVPLVCQEGRVLNGLAMNHLPKSQRLLRFALSCMQVVTTLQTAILILFSRPYTRIH